MITKYVRSVVEFLQNENQVMVETAKVSKGILGRTALTSIAEDDTYTQDCKSPLTGSRTTYLTRERYISLIFFAISSI